jgi:hypothetical protein
MTVTLIFCQNWMHVIWLEQKETKLIINKHNKRSIVFCVLVSMGLICAQALNGDIKP